MDRVPGRGNAFAGAVASGNAIRVGFAAAAGDGSGQAKLNEIPTRLRLPVDQVDLTIEAGRKALEVNSDIKAAVAAIQARAGVRPATITTAKAH
ncbi:hypothetical protein ACWGS9_32665 [Bradyrhizobium sp. Arg314]